MGGFWAYLKNDRGIDLNTIQYLIGKYGEEISEDKINKILILLDSFKEFNIDIKFLNENHNIFDIIEIEDMDEYQDCFKFVLDYVKMKKKKKNPYPYIMLLMVSRQIKENKKEEEAKRIIELLEREGLYFVFESKDPKTKEILYKSTYDIISKNIAALKKTDKYYEIVRKNPSILITLNVKELEELLKNSKKDDKKKDEEIEKEETANENENIDSSNNNQENADEDVNEVIDNVEESGNIYLGEEEKVKEILEAFLKYNISYDILILNPEIVRRRKAYQVPEILDLMYNNNIPFSILYRCPEILELGKAEEVESVIKQLKNSDLSITILVTCPEILIKSDPDKIKKVIDSLEKVNVNKYTVYTYPQLLIQGSIDNLVDSFSANAKKVEDINEILENTKNYYVYFEELVQSSAKDKKTLEDDLSLREDAIIIKDIYNAKNNIRTIGEHEIDVQIVKQKPSILNIKTNVTDFVIKKIESDNISKQVVTDNPEILVQADSKNISQTIDLLKKYLPNDYDKVIASQSQILYETDVNDIKKAFKALKIYEISDDFIANNPKVLLRKEPFEISDVLYKLEVNGYNKEEILQTPSILIYGKAKYIDRNIDTFERNSLNIPLSVVHVISARNNEKNIDTLIENDLYQYIEATPEILSIKNSTLMQHINIAKDKDLPIINSDTNTFDMEYFMASDEKLAQKYNLDKVYVDKQRERAEKAENRLRRVERPDLYNGFFSILNKQANITLNEYENDKVSYIKHGKKISKQKVVRETYLDIEEKVTIGGKAELKKISAEETLKNKLEELALGEKVINKEYER